MSRLSGKVAVVTGAGRSGNIGAAVCEAFLREGARAVVATDLRSEDFGDLAERMAKASADGEFRAEVHDVTDQASWQEVADRTVRDFGGLDVLVNNAGISIHGTIEDTSLEDLRKVMAVNHDALFLGMKVALPALTESRTRFAGGGSIINNLSMSTYMPSMHNLGYHVAKAAGRMLTLCGALEFGTRHVRVNSVHPGLTMTPLIEEGLEGYVAQGRWPDRDAAEAGIAESTLLKEASQPEDTAHAFVYLASEEAKYVTGASLYHDGGLGRRF